ncbi:MAG: hypothetical protein AB1429_01785 [Pseudomonadota bacterium]|jgi:hypothetical protein
MRLISLAPMVFAATILAAGVSAIAGSANAAEPRLTDVQYWQASQCAGAAKALGDDTRALDAFLDRQSLQHDSYVIDHGAELAQQSALQVKRGGFSRLAAQQAHDGACQAYLHGPTATATATASGR